MIASALSSRLSVDESASVIDSSIFRSAPAQNPFPAPVRMIPTTAGSRSAWPNASATSKPMRAVQAFRNSGRLSVIVATGSATSYMMCSYATALFVARLRASGRTERVRRLAVTLTRALRRSNRRRRAACPSSSMEEQRTFNPLVQGSSPWGGTTRSARLVILDPITLEGLRTGLAHSVGIAEQFGIAPDLRRAGYVFTDDPTGPTAWRPDRANARWERARSAVGLTARSTRGRKAAPTRSQLASISTSLSPVEIETSPPTTIYHGEGEPSSILERTNPFVQPCGNEARSTLGSDHKRPRLRFGSMIFGTSSQTPSMSRRPLSAESRVDWPARARICK